MGRALVGPMDPHGPGPCGPPERQPFFSQEVSWFEVQKLIRSQEDQCDVLERRFIFQRVSPEWHGLNVLRDWLVPSRASISSSAA